MKKKKKEEKQCERFEKNGSGVKLFVLMIREATCEAQSNLRSLLGS